MSWVNSVQRQFLANGPIFISLDAVSPVNSNSLVFSSWEFTGKDYGKGDHKNEKTSFTFSRLFPKDGSAASKNKKRNITAAESWSLPSLVSWDYR